MHLGINLQKAFLAGIISEDIATDTGRKYHPVDKFVHEFCKLLGKHGTPEYCLGARDFPDFLKLMINDQSLCADSHQYYESCSKVNLHRQVGSRYFVSASNAARIVFLADAAVAFLKYMGKESGNKLETDVFVKLTNGEEMAMLRVDGLMYYHIYADLVMLSKSKALSKSVLDMSNHYLELLCFLNEIQKSPELVMNKHYEVFQSEKRLYGADSTLNHRCQSILYSKLFEERGDESSILYPMVIAGAAKMKVKLLSYAEKYLPGGEYWNPEPAVRKILTELKPSNDFCESLLGLNDYLTTAIPNLTQASRSNLVQVKKNHTMQWLNTLPEEQQDKLLDFAAQERPKVIAEQKKFQENLSNHRQLSMFQAHLRREALKTKAQKERDELMEHHLVTTSQELRQTLRDIESQNLSAQKNKNKKLSLLKTQIKIRKKVLNQNICIPVSHARKQRSISEISMDLEHFIDNYPLEHIDYFQDPSTLVGKDIWHKFMLEDTNTVKWYHGTVVDYDALKKKHEIKYDD